MAMCFTCGAEKLTEQPCPKCGRLRNATKDEIVRRIITTCNIRTVIECRLWECQRANKCVDGHLGSR